MGGRVGGFTRRMSRLEPQEGTGMKLRKSRAVAAAVPLAALVALLAVLAPSVSAAESSEGVTTIEIKMEGKKMGFFGPSTVHEGEELRIVNDTMPSMVGPHTFSLVEK